MSKSQKTLDLERSIYNATSKMGVFGCFEVTMGWYGKERVDYMTYDTKGIFRCYEIKVSKADFYSKATHTFVGHYNYYVMPSELLLQVKNDIPSHIGIYTDGSCIHKAKKQELKIHAELLKDYMIRSLSRYFNSAIMNGNPNIIQSYKNISDRAIKESRDSDRKYNNLLYDVTQKYGRHWNREEGEK